MTNELLINRFLNYQRRDGKSVLTLSAYATDLKQFLLLLSPLSLSSLSPSKLTDLCRKWTAGLLPNAAARKLATLRSFLSWAYRGGYIKSDLATTVSRPKRKTVFPAKPLSLSQIARLRRTATVQERLLLELLLQTGMRLPEVLAIKMKHLRMPKGSDLSKDLILSAEIRHPKSVTKISVSDILRQSLKYYLAAMTRGPRSYLLVSGRTGRPPGLRAAGMMLSKLGKRAGVRGVSPRNLRATFRSGMSARARIRT